jgi:hypothetical protein
VGTLRMEFVLCFYEVDGTTAFKATMVAETEVSYVQITIQMKLALLRHPY